MSEQDPEPRPTPFEQLLPPETDSKWSTRIFAIAGTQREKAHPTHLRAYRKEQSTAGEASGSGPRAPRNESEESFLDFSTLDDVGQHHDENQTQHQRLRDLGLGIVTLVSASHPPSKL
ncbi:uncharacterized protein PAC_06527 [Phialocephala subalpina]|uniref:Uncharacterized protein n=1 Tax=Phialocephala subalpina TaxID=576137 RepID=A0A1L7WV44_9HELO|nr:uncharacterized protein PAC_06527 [Phialocephala subalpina]